MTEVDLTQLGTMKGSIATPRDQAFLYNMIEVDGRLHGRPSFRIATDGLGDYSDNTRDYSPFGSFVITNSLYYKQPANYSDRFRVFGIYSTPAFLVPPIDQSIKVFELSGIRLEERAELAVRTTPFDRNRSIAVGDAHIVIAGHDFEDVDNPVGANIYLEEQTGSLNLTESSVDSNLPVSSTVTFIDGRFVWSTREDGLIYWSDVNDPSTVGATSFMDAETVGDKTRWVTRFRNDLIALGDKSIERFRSTGSATTPFTRITNSIVSVGYVGAGVHINDLVYFIGRDQSGAYRLFVYNGQSAIPVSYGIVDEILNAPTHSLTSEIDVFDMGVTNFRGGSLALFSLRNNMVYMFVKDGQHKFGLMSGLTGSTDPTNVDRVTEDRFMVRSSATSTLPAFGVANKIDSVFFAEDGAYYFYEGGPITSESSTTDDQAYTDVDQNAVKWIKNSGPKTPINPNSNQTINKGIRFVIQKPEDADMSMSELKIAFSSTDGIDDTGDLPGTSDDVVVATFSNDGTNWSAPETRVIGNKPDHEMVVFNTFGSLMHAYGRVIVCINTNARMPLTIDGIYYSFS